MSLNGIPACMERGECGQQFADKDLILSAFELVRQFDGYAASTCSGTAPWLEQDPSERDGLAWLEGRVTVHKGQRVVCGQTNLFRREPPEGLLNEMQGQTQTGRDASVIALEVLPLNERSVGKTQNSPLELRANESAFAQKRCRLGRGAFTR